MSETLEKYKVQIVISIVIVSLVVSGYFIFGPKPPEASFGQIDRPTIDNGFRVATNELQTNLVTDRQIPNKAQVFKIKKKKLSNTETISLAKKFGFTSKPKSKNPYIWREGKKELTVNNNSYEIDYRNNTIKGTDRGLNEKQLVEKARKFLNDKGLLKKDLIANNNLTFLTQLGFQLSVVNEFNKANFVRADFDKRIGDLYVYNNGHLSVSASVTLNKKGQVSKLIYSYFEEGEKSQYSLRTKEEAFEAAERQGIFVNTNQEGEIPIQFRRFENILIEDSFLAYLYEPSKNFIQPIYILRGKGNIGDYSTDVIIQVPALEAVWLK